MRQITVETVINEPVEKVWEYYNAPQHIRKWNHASADWHCPRASNDLRVNGTFTFRMEEKVGGEGFDFSGKYDAVELHEKIAYTMEDGRKVLISFEPLGNSTHMKIAFDPETQNTIELQQSGWQAILENFKTYVENN